MELELIGPHPFGRDGQAGQTTRIGTVFPAHGVLYTLPPEVHMWQRRGFLDLLNTRRAESGRPLLSPEEEEDLCAGSVDLIFGSNQVLIRPNPERMDLAFAADELLQALVSKRQIKFLNVSDQHVREAIKKRGEFWRLSCVPKTQDAKEQLVFKSRVAIHGRPIYFYNQLTGTRWLTFQEFENLGRLDDAALACHLQEIADHAPQLNRLNKPEVAFFAADLRRLGPREFAGVVYEQLSGAELRAKFEEMKERFRSAVHEAYRRDDPQDKNWCDKMLSALFLEGNDTQTEHVLRGLSPEFFLHVEWLPGGRFEEGEFLFDSVFDEAVEQPENADLQQLCDPRARGIIFNHIREYGDLEYINLGRVPEPLSRRGLPQRGRRGVYIAELKPRSEPQSIKRFMRLQKFDVWHHLDLGKDLLKAIEESDEYTDYWLDRRLGCRQLGMNLTHRVLMRRLSEVYQGTNTRYHDQLIRTTYFEREYLPGIASDKLPVAKLAQPGYATKLAQLLGRAAAASLIVGRSLEQGTSPVFDDGDEVVCEGRDGLPAEILVGDHSGAFGEYRRPLENFAPHYARPVNVRDKHLTDAREFAEAYLAALREQFLRIQGDYRKRRRAFATLFKHCKYDPQGSFAYRWERVLARLDLTDGDELVKAVRGHIFVLRDSPQPVDMGIDIVGAEVTRL